MMEEPLSTTESGRDPQIEEMALWLGIDPDMERELLWIAELAISAPLPEHWTEFTSSTGIALFRDKRTGETQGDHPLDDAFRLLVERARRSLQKITKEELEAVASAVDRVADVTYARRRGGRGRSEHTSRKEQIEEEYFAARKELSEREGGNRRRGNEEREKAKLIARRLFAEWRTEDVPEGLEAILERGGYLPPHLCRGPVVPSGSAIDERGGGEGTDDGYGHGNRRTERTDRGASSIQQDSAPTTPSVAEEGRRGLSGLSSETRSAEMGRQGNVENAAAKKKKRSRALPRVQLNLVKQYPPQYRETARRQRNDRPVVDYETFGLTIAEEALLLSLSTVSGKILAWEAAKYGTRLATLLDLQLKERVEIPHGRRVNVVNEHATGDKTRDECLYIMSEHQFSTDRKYGVRFWVRQLVQSTTHLLEDLALSVRTKLLNPSLSTARTHSSLDSAFTGGTARERHGEVPSSRVFPETTTDSEVEGVRGRGARLRGVGRAATDRKRTERRGGIHEQARDAEVIEDDDEEERHSSLFDRVLGDYRIEAEAFGPRRGCCQRIRCSRRTVASLCNCIRRFARALPGALRRAFTPSSSMTYIPPAADATKGARRGGSRFRHSAAREGSKVTFTEVRDQLVRSLREAARNIETCSQRSLVLLAVAASTGGLPTFLSTETPEIDEEEAHEGSADSERSITSRVRAALQYFLPQRSVYAESNDFLEAVEQRLLSLSKEEDLIRWIPRISAFIDEQRSWV